MTFDELYARAKSVVNPRLLTDTACSMGFCAEHAAAATMITAGARSVVKMIAVGRDGQIMPPCGRCREFISQLDDDNVAAKMMVARGIVVELQELLPHDGRVQKSSDISEGGYAHGNV